MTCDPEKDLCFLGDESWRLLDLVGHLRRELRSAYRQCGKPGGQPEAEPQEDSP